MAWLLLFILSALLLSHSYVFFPLILRIKARNKTINQNIYALDAEELPPVSILLAAYNEEKVIREKIESTFNTNYPLQKIEFLIGSDASSDQTNKIIEEESKKYPGLKLITFPGRTGKAGIINHLATLAQHDILILTDANVFFRPETIYELVKHYKNEGIHLVGGNIKNSRFIKNGISIQEEAYISRENNIKFREGIIWGSMAGAFGGCYSLRKDYYKPVPPRFFMDDFYISMHVLQQNGRCINELNALCDEDVSNKIREEFRRKIRISIGNFQNLKAYRNLLWKAPRKGIAFSFWSHKVLRWLGPFFLILIFISNLALMGRYPLFKWVFAFQCLIYLLPVFDLILRKFKVHISLLRFLTHFIFMNAALLVGFVKFIRGVKSNIWQPTERFQ